MRDYVQTLQRHLATYKRFRLGVNEAGTYVHKGRELRYAHILPKELRWLNVLEPVRAEVRRYVEGRAGLKLHKYFHHLNSSQAFAFNIFFPYFERGEASVLLRAMGIPGEVAVWHPEYVGDTQEGTNVDVMWQSPSGAKTFCEVKLSEQGFGTARDDKRHRKKLEDIYRPILAGQCAPELLEPKRFFANYQLLRNVWLAAKDTEASVVFLVPRANTALWAQLGPFFQLLAPALARRVRGVAAEDVLASLTVSSHPPTKLVWLAELLREKYVVPAAAA